MNWQGMAVFIVAAEQQSFTQAAKKLGSSVAHVSRTIAQLEQEHNSILFVRSTRKVVLSAQGELLYHHAKKAQNVLEQGQWALAQQQLQHSGKLRITAPVMFGEQFIMPLVHDFMIEYPRVSVEMLLTNHAVDLISEHIDLAIRIGELADSNLRAKRLASRRILVCGSSKYFADAGKPQTLNELVDHQCLKGHADYWRFSDKGRIKHVKIPPSRLHCNSGWALANAALKGLGLVQLPDYYVSDALAKGQLSSVLDGYAIVNEPISALAPSNLLISNTTKALLDYLSERLEGRLNSFHQGA